MTAGPERSPLALDAGTLANTVAGNEADPVDVVRQTFHFARDHKLGPDGLNAVLWSDQQAAVKEARELHTRLASGLGRRADDGEAELALVGVPYVAKDNIATVGLRTTCGSKILADYVSPFEATVVRRLRDAGAILVGKTNMDEFAMGSSTEHSAWRPTHNPVDTTRVPGGSSGGSAAAVAAGLVRIALGSETGGSVRQPAAFCGIVGVKPTYGRVSRYGLVAFASSLDQVGVFGRSVNDAALAMQVVSGHDPLDSTSAIGQTVPPYLGAGLESIGGLVIGRPKEYFPESLDARVRERCDRALERLEGAGATIREVSLPHTELAIPVYYIIAPAEASSNLARFDGVRYGVRVDSAAGTRGMYEATRSLGFGREVTRRILLGTYVLSAGYYDAYYKRAQEVRSLIAQDFATVFNSGVHALFTPTAPTPAFTFGAKKDPYEMYMSDIFTAPANLAGVPAISVPIGDVDGLPVGGQIMAPHFGEYDMFRVAFALERAQATAAVREQEGGR